MHLLRPTSVASTGAGNLTSIVGNGSVSFSTCETLSLNEIFSDSYDRYMIVCEYVGSTTKTDLLLRLRASGTNATGNNYSFETLNGTGSTLSASRSTSQTSGRLSNASNNLRSAFVLHLYNPYLSSPTVYTTETVAGHATERILDNTGGHSLSTSYDGITIFPASGNFSGQITVYGMRK